MIFALLSLLANLHLSFAQSQKTAPFPLYFPFSKDVEAVCTHSSGIGSHSWPNAYFAIDLANRYEDPAATIYASEEGTAYIFLGEDGKPCPEPPGIPAKSQVDHCGNSWGNQVKILHKSGYYSFYTHLEKILIQNGDSVKRGQALGVEGWTGSAGHRHLHWSLQKLPGATQAEWESKITWDGESVPFDFYARQNGKLKKFNSAKLKCPHANIGAAPASEQPRFTGTN